jgi:uncharacterized caspase-like protein
MRRLTLAWKLVACLAALAWATGTARAERPGGDSYALLVGVQQYDPAVLRPLKYAESDVTALAEVLRDKGYRPENIVLMTGARGRGDARLLPKAEAIRVQLHRLLGRRKREDRVLVAFAGHGVQLKSGDDECYFCPLDARLDDPSTLVSLSEIYREMERSRAGFMLLLMDACRNNPQVEGSRGSEKLLSVTRPQVKAVPGGMATLFSCAEGQKAFEDDALKHGVFFHFVLEGLKGAAELNKDGEVVLPGLEYYITREVPRYVKEHHSGVQQLPVRRGETPGQVPIVRLNQPRRPATGLYFREATAREAEALRPAAGGLVVEGVLPGLPADKAGLCPGDVIVKRNGRPVTTRREWQASLEEGPVGEVARVELRRGGETVQVEMATVEELPAAEETRRLRPLAEAGAAWAQHRLALRCLNGLGADVDEAQAVQWLRKAAGQGYAPAEFGLAECYREGRGVARDDAEAVRWCRLAAEGDHPRAQGSLGWCYEAGLGVAKNSAEAAKWYRRAAENNDLIAQCNLALLYHFGRGVPRDRAEAARWFTRAAEQGTPGRSPVWATPA